MKKSYYKFSFIFLSILMLSISCSKEKNNVFAYSGEVLFRGIMYGEGPVADMIPQVSLNRISKEEIFSDKEELQVVDEIRTEILRIIQKNNPLFLSDFQQKISSHDPLKIQEALKLASSKVYDSLLEICNIKTNQEKEFFNQELSNASENYVVSNSNGSLNKESTKEKVKNFISEGNRNAIKIQSKSGIKSTFEDKNSKRSLLVSLVLKNNLKSTTTDMKDSEVCVAVLGVVVIAAVIAVVVVEAAVATDTWFWVTSAQSNEEIMSKEAKGGYEHSLYREDFIASIAESI